MIKILKNSISGFNTEMILNHRITILDDHIYIKLNYNFF